MINNVLQEIQKGTVTIEEKELTVLLSKTLELKKQFGNTPNTDYVIDAIVPFVSSFDGTDDAEKADRIFSDEEIKKTLEKSPATTSNVNARLRRVKQLLMEK